MNETRSMVKAYLHKTVKGDNVLSLYDKGFNKDTVADIPFKSLECLANTDIDRICVFIKIESDLEMPAMVKCDQLYYLEGIDMDTVKLDSRFFSEPRWAKRIICLKPKEETA